MTVPPDGYDGFPTNGRLWVREPAFDVGSTELARADGTRIPIVVSHATADSILVTPGELLDCESEYVLRWSAEGGSEVRSLRFSTGEGPDVDPPMLIDAEMESEPLSGDCPLHVGARAEIDAADRDSPSELLLAELEVTEPGRPTERFLVPASHSSFGWSNDPSCLFRYAGARAGDEIHTSVVVVDLAGNRSDRFGPAPSQFENDRWVSIVRVMGRWPAFLACGLVGASLALLLVLLRRKGTAALLRPRSRTPI